MSSNLPPGVSVTDIPGNRPEDEEWDRLFDWLWDTGMEPEQIRAAALRSQEGREPDATITIQDGPFGPRLVSVNYGDLPAGKHDLYLRAHPQEAP